jgi:3'-phosphoadenosine 5'-phosphosulfate sulfotransferase (PAPS reductase)/FAD synthetase
MQQKVQNEKSSYVSDMTIDKIYEFKQVLETVIKLMEKLGLTDVIIKVKMEQNKHDNKTE